MPKWSKEKFKQKENTDLTTRLWSLWKSLMKKDKELSLFHMRSHNKSGWGNFKEGTFEKYCFDQNDYVDSLCEYARKAMKPGQIKISKADYDE